MVNTKTLLFFVSLVLIILIAGCQVPSPYQNEEKFPQPNTKAGLEATANKFAREWEQKDWGSMYNLFTANHQKEKSKENFSALMDYIEQQQRVVIRLDQVDLESSSKGFAYYTVSSLLLESKAPAIKFIYEKGSWNADAFAKYFSMDLEGKKYADKLLPIIRQRLDLTKELRDFTKAKDESSFDGGYLSSLYCKEILDLIKKRADLANQVLQIIPTDQYISKHTSLLKAYTLSTEIDIYVGEYYCGEGNYNLIKRKEIETKVDTLSSTVEYQNVTPTVTSFKEELEEKYS